MATSMVNTGPGSAARWRRIWCSALDSGHWRGAVAVGGVADDDKQLRADFEDADRRPPGHRASCTC
jgi:hypothetical protein